MGVAGSMPARRGPQEFRGGNQRCHGFGPTNQSDETQEIKKVKKGTSRTDRNQNQRAHRLLEKQQKAPASGEEARKYGLF